MSEEITTLVDVVRYFADPENAFRTLVELRWPSGVCCPACGRLDVRFIATRRIWECREMHAKRQFSGRVGTIFEDSPLSLDKWFVAIWMVSNCKNGVSSYELGRTVGVTQKTAWFMLHRIRTAMETGSFMKSARSGDDAAGPTGGEYEADETYFGGKAKFMHKDRKKRVIKGSGTSGKEAVMGILRRGVGDEPSQVTAAHVPNVNRETLQGAVRAAVPEGAALYTDAATAYKGLASEYQHGAVNHPYEYVRGRVWTNGIENFWSILKRAAKGTYVHISPAHLGAYVQEGVFRYNRRKDTDYNRFKLTLANAIGRRLTYKELTSRARAFS
jgi:transposase-like protein